MMLDRPDLDSLEVDNGYGILANTRRGGRGG